MPLRSLWPGSAYEIYAYATDSDRCQVEEFLTSLSKRDRKKMTALLTRAATTDLPVNREKCQKMVGEDFWDFKPSDQQDLLVLHHRETKANRLAARLYEEV